MTEEKNWKDERFEDKNNTWVVAQHVDKKQAPCGCRLNVWMDDGGPGPNLDTSHCTFSNEEYRLQRLEHIKTQIKKLKAEAASL